MNTPSCNTCRKPLPRQWLPCNGCQVRRSYLPCNQCQVSHVPLPCNQCQNVTQRYTAMQAMPMQMQAMQPIVQVAAPLPDRDRDYELLNANLGSRRSSRRHHESRRRHHDKKKDCGCGNAH